MIDKKQAQAELDRIRNSLDKKSAPNKLSNKVGRMERTVFLLVGLMITGIDYVSKVKMQEFLQANDNLIEVTFFFNLVSVYNSGAAFGIFADYGTEFLGMFSLIFCFGLYVFTYLYKNITYAHLLGIAFIFGGGLGNGIDRLVRGSVFDFIDLHLGTLHWPAFNVADMAVVFGVGVIIYTMYKSEKQFQKELN